MTELPDLYLIIVLTPIVALIIFCFYATVVYAIDSKKYDSLVNQLEEVETTTWPEYDVLPPLPWFDSSNLDQHSERSKHTAEVKRLANDIFNGLPTNLDSAKKWLPLLSEIVELSKWQGVVELGNVNCEWARTRRLVDLAIILATLAMDKVATGRDEEGLDLFEATYRLLEVVKRDRLRINLLMVAAVELILVNPLLTIIERRKHSGEFLERLLSIIQKIDLIAELNESTEAEARFGSESGDLDSNSLFKWSPFRRISTYCSMNFAALFLGRRRVTKAYYARFIPATVRESRLRFEDSQSGLDIFEQFKDCGEKLGRWSPYHFTSLNLQNSSASTFAAMAKVATIRSIFRTAIKIYLAAHEERVGVEPERDWFASGPLRIHGDKDMFTLTSVGHGRSYLRVSQGVRMADFLCMSFGVTKRLNEVERAPISG